MTVTRIVQLADGEELISYESPERPRATLVIDDPRRSVLELRGLAEKSQRRGKTADD